MVRVSTVGSFFAAALFAAGLVTGADARDMKVVRTTIAPASADAPKPAPVAIVRDVTPAKLKAAIEPAAAEAVPACARKVKVIYAGYGEADRANCTMASAEPASPAIQKTATR